VVVEAAAEAGTEVVVGNPDAADVVVVVDAAAVVVVVVVAVAAGAAVVVVAVDAADGAAELESGAELRAATTPPVTRLRRKICSSRRYVTWAR
jgi:hypothetical protein